MSQNHCHLRRRTTGRSERNSFYLQKSKEIAGRYKAYYEYDTSGMKVTRAEAVEEGPVSEHPQERSVS